MADGGGVLSAMSASYAMGRRCNSLLSETEQIRAQRIGSEAQLFKLAYAFEQGTLFRSYPASTPALPGERFEYA